MKDTCYIINNKNELGQFIQELFAQHVESPYTDSPNLTDGAIWLHKALDKIDLPFTIMVAESHVDKEFRDSYYMYFSSQHFDVSRFCIRLSFFAGKFTHENFLSPDDIADTGRKKNVELIRDAFIGCCTVRPLLNHEIGKTLLKPEIYIAKDEDIFIRMTKYRIATHGIYLEIKAFPFSTQDGGTTCCVENTILTLLDYFSANYADYKRAMPSEIARIEQGISPERVLPKSGTDYYILSRVLTEFGFHPRIYSDTSKLKERVYHYIESGIPVAVGLNYGENKVGHSVVCIGHSNKGLDDESKRAYIKKRIAEKCETKADSSLLYISTAEFCNNFVVMDDGDLPYHVDSLDNISNVIVPLHKRMYMDSDEARGIFEAIQNDDPRFNIQNRLNEKGLGDKYVITRMYLITGANYKMHLLHSSGNGIDYKILIDHLPFPHFVWVCEYYLEDDYFGHHPPLSFSEIVLDGTSHSKKYMNTILMYRSFDVIATRGPEEDGGAIMDLLNEDTAHYPIIEKQPACFHNLTRVHANMERA
ncbi:MAG: hypothetical protein LBG82_09255 [Clostridiales Family XIII bacterium]|nr:hypothetical protein [Clostridiales Family XIII bacterium]